MHAPDTPRRRTPPQNTVALGAGFGIGIVWIVLAVLALSSAFRGFANTRADWGVAYTLVGLLLAAAGIAAIVGTWLHLTQPETD
jgi:hypothetical protein